ncbi:MAG: benzoate-CoA ligase family protein [Thermodesulfobacteriota bacterium]|nr:benzoate-CoA ligase family protein [Thermodesulfobacteriota bacterium]
MSVGNYDETPSVPQEMNMTTYILDANLTAGRGDKIAIYYQEKTYTFNDLYTLTNKVGNALKELGVERENRVIVILGDSPDWFASWLGAIRIGGVATHAYCYLNPEDYGYFLNYAKPKVVVVDDSTLESVREGAKLSRYPVKLLVKTESPTKLKKGEYDFNAMVKSASKDLEVEIKSKDDFALWLWSGGTTGKSKAVPHMHHDFPIAAESFCRLAQYTEDDVMLSAPKLFFHYAHELMMWGFTSGASAVLFPERTTPQILFKLAEQYKATMLLNVPTMMRAMLQTPEQDRTDLSSLRINFSSGESLPQQLHDEWKATFEVDVVEVIGSAESFIGYIANPPGEKPPGSLGKVVPFVEAKLVDDEGREVPRREDGVLMIRSDCIGTSYFLHHEKSKNTFLGNDWFNTGDVFRLGDDDFFYYSGRKGDSIKVSGVWVSPLEMENQLQQHEKIKECIILGIQDKDGLMQSKAYVVLMEGLEGSESIKKELTTFCKEKLAPHKYPRIIEFMEGLPKTGQGKVDKFRLRERELHSA